MKLIFAQGNPGPGYVGSRHNVGFSVLNELANKYQTNWVNKPKFHATVAELSIAGEKVLLVEPTSFYNETGLAARQIIDFYKIDKAHDMLVLHDDLDLPFGTIRVRKEGSDAGNKGIKSLNTHLMPYFARIRIGTHNDLRAQMDDAKFVLSKFSTDERKQLNHKIMPCILNIIDDFCIGNFKETSYKI